MDPCPPLARNARSPSPGLTVVNDFPDTAWAVPSATGHFAPLVLNSCTPLFTLLSQGAHWDLQLLLGQEH